MFDSGMRYWSVPVFHFPMSAITNANWDAASVTSATLRVFFEAHHGISNLRYVGGGAGTVVLGDYVNMGVNIGPVAWDTARWYEWDVLPRIRESITAGHSHAVFTISPDNFSGGGVRFSESVDFSPQITVIPEPGTYALLFGLGILGLVGYRRLRRRK